MNSKTYSVIGKIIKQARLKKEITQKELSLELGFTSTQYISNIERGITTISADSLGKICLLLGIPDKTIKKLLVKGYVEKIEEGFKIGQNEILKEQTKKVA